MKNSRCMKSTRHNVLASVMVCIMLFVTLFSCLSCVPDRQPTPATRLITDMAGREVEIPVDVTKAATVFPYVTFIFLALGAEAQLVAVDTASANNPNLAIAYPGIEGKTAVGSAFNINLEALPKSTI